MKTSFLHIIVLCFLLGACASESTPDESKNRSYPYFTNMPSDQALEENYNKIRHALSPIADYHFDMLLLNGWETLDIVPDSEPAPGQFKEIGVFRQPGNWMRNDNSSQNAEITVSVVNAGDIEQWASVWLEDTISRNATKYEILEKRIVETRGGDALDMLVSYSDGKQQIMNRIAAFRDDDHIFVISGSDTINGYRDMAEAFYVAIESFTLLKNKTANPFTEH